MCHATNIRKIFLINEGTTWRKSKGFEAIMCGPVLYISDYADEQCSGEIPPVGDQCESAFEDQDKSD